MFRIAICDDEPVFSSQIETAMEYWPNKPADLKTEVFNNGDTLIRAHSETPFDIILLDVIMPFVNGIETAREIRSNDSTVKIVFLTSSPEYAVESYTVKAANYLLKPVNPFDLFQCLDELYGEVHKVIPSINIKIPHAVRKVSLSDIEYVEAQKRHVYFSLADGRSLESTEPFYTYEQQLKLADGFFKCHRSYIVNMYLIDAYTTKEVQMHSGICIPISRSCHKEFEDAYFEAIFGKAGEDN